MKNDIKLYNVLFPFWMLLLVPSLWLIVLPGNFVIDSLVLLAAMAIFRVTERKRWYKQYIVLIFCFGILSDMIGSAYMLLMTVVFQLGRMGDEWYLTVPAILIAAVAIFLLNYFVTFRREEKAIRLKMALTFAIVTAPYTFLIPSSWLYG